MLELPDMNTHALPPSIKKASSVIVTKSPYDDREYKYMELPNKMRVLLISDPNTDKAAACMAVNVGSLSDPHQLPGLAHFCEHMLFLGTMKYPIENAYSKFVLEHGGRYNACTSTDETCFAFDINPNNLDKALDIFAQFFIAPLFTESATDREVFTVLLVLYFYIAELVNRMM
ncbi:hypothetical protein EG68_11785 [Paragonimus skrjabini miyazakii]|uniref:Peptidase M16 N-terminal domain-containing protein n=1 Tax=Paragonimus skrjabini miyazakii TaxID=59628 RepID=A0A8S9YH02_9TREM|nr:hypothetical protein EG68_11785 [Paragonimus skrjabini miyazakii]